MLLSGFLSGRLAFVLLTICASLAAPVVLRAAYVRDAAEMSATDEQSRPPRPIEPPHKPAQGARVSLLFGLNLFAYGQYAYNTTITLPDGRALNYAGKQNASGGSFFVGAAFNPPAALRRFTVGATLNAGGLTSWTHPVIPSGVVTPFSQNNLNAQVQRNAVFSYGWRPSFSPYIEHELGFLLESRVRVGYQYWRQFGSYGGSFPVDSPQSALAGYNVRLSQSSHLIRLSLNNHLSLDDDTDPNAVHRKQNPGFVRQGGLLIGTNHTVMVFIGLGPAWSF